MKGTRLWQAPRSPLIQGKSRQIRPLWQPWLGAVSVSLAVSNAVAWQVFHAFPVEFFVVASVVGAFLGVWVARRMGWRRSWAFGAGFALFVDVALFMSVSNWASWALLHVDKVG